MHLKEVIELQRTMGALVSELTIAQTQSLLTVQKAVNEGRELDEFEIGRLRSVNAKLEKLLDQVQTTFADTVNTTGD